MTPFSITICLVAVLGFVLIISKMGMEYCLKMEKIKRGYPIEDVENSSIEMGFKNNDMKVKEDRYIDYTEQGNHNN